MSRGGRFVRAIADWLAVVRGVFSRHEKLFWAASIAVVVVVQWPVLKGFYLSRGGQTWTPP